MTREEYNDYRYIRGYKSRGDFLGRGTVLTIPTDANPDYKHRLDDLYTSWGFHPADVKVDAQTFDNRERVLYIFGRNEKYTDFYGRTYGWESLYTETERARFAAALN